MVTDSVSAEENCKASGPHEAVSVFLIDRTDSSPLGENYSSTLFTVKKMLRQGERIIAAPVVDRRANSTILIDVVRPKESIWEPKLAFVKKDIAFTNCIRSLELLSDPQPKGKVQNSAILETLTYLQEILSLETVSAKRLFLYSDMIQNSDALNLYRTGPKDSVETLMAKVEHEHLVPNLKGVEVFVAGVGGSQTDKQARFTEAFWRALFEKAGATVKFYGPALVQQ